MPVDVLYTSIKAKEENTNVARETFKKGVFHSLASLAIPSIILHKTVTLSQKAFLKIGRYTRWGPVLTGLALIPILPFTVDYPIEHLVDTYL